MEANGKVILGQDVVKCLRCTRESILLDAAADELLALQNRYDCARKVRGIGFQKVSVGACAERSLSNFPRALLSEEQYL